MIACAALAIAGLLLLTAEITGTHITIPRPRPPWRARAGIALAAVLAWVITGWPVAALATVIGIWLGPRVLSGSREQRRIERIEALERWCRQLADTMTGAAGLEQALRATAAEAPPPIRPQVQTLARHLDSGVQPEQALRAFAGEIGDPVADMTAAALILAVQARGHGLADMLTRLARTVARDVAAQREIDAERAGHRTTARWVAVVLAAYTAFALIDRSYTAPFAAPTGADGPAGRRRPVYRRLVLAAPAGQPAAHLPVPGMNMVLVVLAGGAGLGVFLIVRELFPAPPALRPALARFTCPAQVPAGLGERLAATPLARRVPREDLALLGQAPGAFLARQAAYGLAGLAVPALAWLVLQPPLPWVALPIVTAGSAAVLIATPVLQIRTEAARAREDFREALIAYLDLVALARTAGAAPAGALEIPVRICRGWAFGRLAHALDPARRGTAATWDALSALAEQIGLPEIAGIVAGGRRSGCDRLRRVTQGE